MWSSCLHLLNAKITDMCTLLVQTLFLLFYGEAKVVHCKSSRAAGSTPAGRLLLLLSAQRGVRDRRLISCRGLEAYGFFFFFFGRGAGIRSNLSSAWVEGLCQSALPSSLRLPGTALLEWGRDVCSVEAELLHVAKIRCFVWTMLIWLNCWGSSVFFRNPRALPVLNSRLSCVLPLQAPHASILTSGVSR